jgi:hypothetical protein
LVKLLNGGGLGAIWGVVEITPGTQLREGVVDLGRGGGRQEGVNLGGAQRDDEAGAFGNEDAKNCAVEAGFLDVEVRENRIR